MSTCRDIIASAALEISAVQLGEEMQPAEADEGLRRLNQLLSGLAGMGIGEAEKSRDALSLLNHHNANIPANTRILATDLTASMTLKLPCRPSNGARVSLIDVDGVFATYPVTLDPNGSKIEGSSASLAANTASFSRTWVYIASAANWQRVSDVGLDDDFPYPADSEQAFVALMALRLSPVFQLPLTPEAQAAVIAATGSLSARYRQRVVTSADTATLVLGRQAIGDFWCDRDPLC